MKLEELRRRLRDPDQDPDRPKPPKRGKKAARDWPAPPMHAHTRARSTLRVECYLCNEEFEYVPESSTSVPTVCKECQDDSPF